MCSTPTSAVASGSWTQMFPPKPTFTENELWDLSGKVYIVTGSNSGVGKELVQILYAKNAKVYVAARNESKALEAMTSIKAAVPSSTGSLEYLQLQLEDLTAVAKSAKDFLKRESRLDVLFNNAGIMHPPQGSKSAQGYELQIGVQNLGHGLFTELLTPLLARTAKTSPKDSVRIVWAASLYAEMQAPPGGFDPQNINYKEDKDKYYKYAVSKAGVYYQGAEYARRHKDDGIISVTVNPGNLKSGLQRNMSSVYRHLVNSTILYPAINGAYSELFGGLSPEVTLEKSGSYIFPWGRFGNIRSDLALGALPTSEGGTGMAVKWFDWCMEQLGPFM